jgi:probable phosphoglycerate mutase
VIPGAESWGSFQARCVGAIERITAQHRGERVLTVVHGGVIGAVLAHVARSSNFAFVGADNSSVSEIVHMGDPFDRWMLRRFNDVTHLD